MIYCTLLQLLFKHTKLQICIQLPQWPKITKTSGKRRRRQTTKEGVENGWQWHGCFLHRNITSSTNEWVCMQISENKAENTIYKCHQFFGLLFGILLKFGLLCHRIYVNMWVIVYFYQRCGTTYTLRKIIVKSMASFWYKILFNSLHRLTLTTCSVVVRKIISINIDKHIKFPTKKLFSLIIFCECVLCIVSARRLFIFILLSQQKFLILKLQIVCIEREHSG